MDLKRIVRLADFGAAVLFLIFGAAGFVLSSSLAMGTTLKMGPGYLPRLMSGVVIFFGALTLFVAVFKQVGPTVSGIRIRPLLAVLASIGVFGATVERLGLPLAILLMVATAGLATRDLGKIELFLIGLILAIVSTLLFITFLELSIPYFPRALGR